MRCVTSTHKLNVGSRCQGLQSWESWKGKKNSSRSERRFARLGPPHSKTTKKRPFFTKKPGEIKYGKYNWTRKSKRLLAQLLINNGDFTVVMEIMLAKVRVLLDPIPEFSGLYMQSPLQFCEAKRRPFFHHICIFFQFSYIKARAVQSFGRISSPLMPEKCENSLKL